MSIGRVELIQGNKKYIQYAGSKKENEITYKDVYIERFVKTEKLFERWTLNKGDDNVIYSKMYDPITNKYLGKNTRYYGSIVDYLPLSFSAIVFYKAPEGSHPQDTVVMDRGFFAHLGIGISMEQGIFRFTNQKSLSENPFYTWYKAYLGKSSVNENEFKSVYPAILFRGLLKKPEKDNLMYLGFNSRNFDDAEDMW